MLFRVLSVVILLAGVVFCLKEKAFELILAPHRPDFCTFVLAENVANRLGLGFSMPEYDIPLISTELSAQFMAHISVSCLLAVLLASPYILFELLKFISPALYEREKKYSFIVAGVIYAMFISGLMMSYFILFPISFQFLATYQVDAEIVNTITIDSYISTFTTLTFMMGIVFQLPLIVFVLGKMGFVDADILRRYRAHALVLIMVVSGIITPPDLFSLILVTIPVYGLYELSILVLNRCVGKV